MKFGGTSVGNSTRIAASCALIAKAAAVRPVVAVVSAMSKVTDLLLDTTKHAEAGDRPVLDRNIETLRNRHLETARELLSGSELQDVEAAIAILVGEFQRIVGGMELLAYRPPRAVDEAIAIGERLSSVLISAYLRSTGVSSEAVNAAEVVVTDAVFNNASPIMDATRQKANSRLAPVLANGIVPVVTGFNGATADGRPTTLGRGGSDFSASILAASLDASELWIWSDVDGIMTADPRLVPNAKILDEITYAEAAELAWAGAKVLHPRTLAPIVERGIPVWSKNSFSPEKPGTRIVSKLGEGNAGARAVTSMANVTLVSLEPANPAVSGVHVMASWCGMTS